MPKHNVIHLCGPRSRHDHSNRLILKFRSMQKQMIIYLLIRFIGWNKSLSWKSQTKCVCQCTPKYIKRKKKNSLVNTARDKRLWQSKQLATVSSSWGNAKPTPGLRAWCARIKATVIFQVIEIRTELDRKEIQDKPVIETPIVIKNANGNQGLEKELFYQMR